MAKQSFQNPSFKTPKGTFKFPRLNKPDTKFKAEGEYSVKLILDGSDPEVQALTAKLSAMYQKALENAEDAFKALPVRARKAFEAKGIHGPVANDPFAEVYDEETEQPTGEVEMVFKMAASGKYKSGPKTGKEWTRKPVIFDARGKEMTNPPDIWGGTVGRVSFEVGVDRETGVPGYFIPGTAAAGISLRLQAAQIIRLVQGGQRDAAGYGFGVEEGYEYDPEAAARAAEKDSEGDGDGDADDGDGDF